MTTENQYALFDGDTEYRVELIFSDYEGALNRKYGMVFHCFSASKTEPKAISIAISGLVIDMWTRVGGNENVFEDKEAFAWQIVQSYLHKLQEIDVVKI